jgi:polysaccharide biosynthesis transport protein
MVAKRDNEYSSRRIMRMPAEAAVAPGGNVIDVVAEAPAETVALSDLMDRLWRRRLAIAGAGLVGLLLGIGVCMIETPIYRAKTSVQIEGFNESYFLKDIMPVSPYMANATAQNYLQNQVKVLESDTLARSVANQLNGEGVRRTPKLSERAVLYLTKRGINLIPPPASMAIRPRDVHNALSVDTSLQSQVIEVLYDDPNAEVAARAANLAVDDFIELNQQARAQVVEDTTRALARQTAELKAKVERANRDVEDYARRSGLVFAGGATTLGEDRMKQLEDAYTKAEADRVAKQSSYEAALNAPTDTLPDSIVTGPLHQYQTQLETLRQQLADAKALYTPEHYKVQRLEAQIAELEGAIGKERNGVIARLRTEYTAAKAVEDRLSAARLSQLNTVQGQSEKEAQYMVLKHEADATQKLYESVMEKTREAAVASALGGTNLRIIDRASAPIFPYSPNIPLNSAIGLALGLIGGVGLVLVGGRSTHMTQAGDTALPDVPELGVIPSAKDDHGLNLPRRKLLGADQEEGLELVTWHQDSSLLAESFRATLASILFSTEMGSRANPDPFRRSRALVVTSPEPAEGKTTVLTNLGIAFAETKRRVLLVDADMRRPRLHHVFDLCNDWGLSDLLQSTDRLNGDLQSLARPTSVPDLWVLPSGPGADGFSKLLYSPALRNLLARFRREFDLVLIDTPPMMLYSDARILGRMAAGAVVVVRANRTDREKLKTCYRVLSEDHTPVLGTVLNDCHMDRKRYRAYERYYKPYTGARS